MHVTIQANEPAIVAYTVLCLGRQIEMREVRSLAKHQAIDQSEPQLFETFQREIWIKTNGHPARMVSRREDVSAACKSAIDQIVATPHDDNRVIFDQLFTTLTHYAI